MKEFPFRTVVVKLRVFFNSIMWLTRVTTNDRVPFDQWTICGEKSSQDVILIRNRTPYDSWLLWYFIFENLFNGELLSKFLVKFVRLKALSRNPVSKGWNFEDDIVHSALMTPFGSLCYVKHTDWPVLFNWSFRRGKVPTEVPTTRI